MAHRYLLHISYIGKPFWGAQRQVKRTILSTNDPNTVQGRLEMGLKFLNPTNEPIIALSSRTDSGVHAINTTCHVDLYREGCVFEPATIRLCLNRFFLKEDIPIRVLQSYQVPATFHCRYNAISRTYLYRILVKKTDDRLSKAKCSDYIPIEDWGRCQFLCTNEFDFDLVEKASKLFEGYHDFRTFMGKHFADKEKVTRRNVEYVKIIKRGVPGYSEYSWPSFLNYDPEDYLGIDIYIKGSSFLYRQVRRTVAALVGVAQGKITLNDIKLMLEIPSPQSWCSELKVVPAHGLYLCEVGYTKDDIKTFRTTTDA